MSNKAKGTRWELECQKMLEAEGYWVTKAGGSLGAFDLVALGDENIICVQCKCNRWADPDERKTMEQLPALANGDVFIEIWRKDDYKPAPRIMYLSGDEWITGEITSEYWQSVRACLKEQK